VVNSAGTGVHDTLSGLSVVADADRDGYAAGNYHRRINRDTPNFKPGCSSRSRAAIWRTMRRRMPAADGAGWFLRDVRRYRGAAIGFLQRANSGAGADTLPAGNTHVVEVRSLSTA
jgi:hypothetical protein